MPSSQAFYCALRQLIATFCAAYCCISSYKHDCNPKKCVDPAAEFGDEIIGAKTSKNPRLISFQ